MKHVPPVSRSISLLLLLCLLSVGLLIGQLVLANDRQTFMDCLLDTLPTQEALVHWLTFG